MSGLHCVLAGPESERCARLIEAHKQCLRSEGFKVHASCALAMTDILFLCIEALR